MKLTKEQELLRQNIREFVKNEMAEYPDHVDETNCIPQDIIEKLAKIKNKIPRTNCTLGEIKGVNIHFKPSHKSKTNTS